MRTEIVGLACPFGVWRPKDGRWIRYEPDCFDRGGLLGPIQLWVNHQADGGGLWGVTQPLARTSNGSLSLFTNRAGLFFRASIDGTVGRAMHAITHVSVGCWGTVRTSRDTSNDRAVEMCVTEISLLIGRSPRFPETWVRLAGQYAEHLVVMADVAARRRELDELRQAC